MNRYALFAVIFAAGLTAFPAVVTGTDHRPTRITLVVGSQFQSGRLVHSTWVRRDGELCRARVLDGTGGFPSSMVVPAGRAKLRLRISKRQRPHFAVFKSWGDVTGGDQTVGSARRHPLRWRRSGEHRWTAIAVLHIQRTRYFEFTARWPDRDGCAQVVQERVERFTVAPRGAG